MTDLPEHDRALIANKRSAEHFLQLLNPTPDYGKPQGPVRAWEPEPVQASFHFHVLSDTPDHVPAVQRVLRGTLAQHFDELAKTNTERRVGIHVEVDLARAIIGEFHAGLPKDALAALHCEPSITIHAHPGRRGAVPEKGVWQVIWLTEDSPAQRHRAAVAEWLTRHNGRTVDRVRLPGFYNRQGEPFMVTARGTIDSQGAETVRYAVADLMTAFTKVQEAA